MSLAYKHRRHRRRLEQMRVRSYVSQCVMVVQTLEQFQGSFQAMLDRASPTNNIPMAIRYSVEHKPGLRIDIWHHNAVGDRDYVVSTVWPKGGAQ